MTGMQITIDVEALTPLITKIVEEVLGGTVGRQMIFTEQDAAAMLSLEPHQLAGERKRGRIKASVTAGRRIRYHRDDILEYLRGNRWTGRGRDAAEAS